MQRRDLIQLTLASTPLLAFGGVGLFAERALAQWPADVFHADALEAVFASLFPDLAIHDTDRIQIDAPDIAENGAVVPVEVSIRLPAATTLTLLSDGNPFPLLARARLTAAIDPWVATRVKLGQSARLIAVVEAEGGLYRASRPVKVTAGGCGLK